MRILSVVGARPQFIKAAVVSRELRKQHEEILVHTGQHFDYNMSGKFFDEMDIPEPDYNLGISGGTHAEMTAKMMVSLEKIMKELRPDLVVIYGDTNSTLAAALSAVKLHLRICHVESGVRNYDMDNPEEINRIVADHISTLLLACTEKDYKDLCREGLENKAILVGDPMYDAFIKYGNNISPNSLSLHLLSGQEIELPQKYYYVTCHREENSNETNLSQILDAIECLPYKAIYPVHPRNRIIIQNLLEVNQYNNIMAIEPVGYIESLYLLKNSEKVLTDSGGVQREAFFAEKQCITVLNHITWGATMVDRRNQLAKPEKNDILQKMRSEQVIDPIYKPFGNGRAAEKILSTINERFL